MLTIPPAAFLKVVKKVWGKEIWIVNDPDAGYCMKLMWLEPGHQCSLHRHPKDETFVILKSVMLMETEQDPETEIDMSTGYYERAGEEVRTCTHLLKVGERVRIHSGQWHRFFGVWDSVCEFIEVSQAHSDEEVERWPGELSK